MGKQNDRRLLAEKYRNGQCTPDEIKRIQAWYDQLEDSHNLMNVIVLSYFNT